MNDVINFMEKIYVVFVLLKESLRRYILFELMNGQDSNQQFAAITGMKS